MSPPLRLVFLCNSPAVPAGVEKTVLLLLRYLDPAEIAPRVICNGEGPFPESLRAIGADVEVVTVPGGRLSRRFTAAVRDSLRRRPAEVVQLHLSRALAPMLRRSGAKVVERLNMTRHAQAWYPLRWRPLDLLTACWIDHFVVVSESLRQSFIERGYPADKLTVVHNGIELPHNFRRDKLRREWGFPPDAPVVAGVGRLTRQKGFDVFLETAALLATTVPTARFVIAGDGEEREALARRAADLGIADKVLFLGYRQDVLDVLGSVDLLFYPSLWEPFANTILEAMSVGTPVVASDVGGNPEAIDDGKNGRLVPTEDPAAAATCLAELLASPELRLRLVETARRDCTRFSVGQMIRGHERVYVALCHRS